MHYLFVVPEYESFVSGGNIYNRLFIDALSAIAKVETKNWASFLPGYPIDTIIVIDSIYIELIESENEQLKKNSVLLLHHLDIFYEEKNNSKLISKRLKQLSTFEFFIATGQFTYDWLVQVGIKKENIFFLTPVIQIQGSKKYNDQNLKRRLLMVGNLLPRKGYMEFLTALDCEKSSEIQITILGDKNIDTSYSKDILKMIERSPYLNNVCSIKETVANESMPAYFDENDVMISASHFETFGIAVHEALFYGLPVWAIAAGNIINIKHPLLTTFKTHKEIVSALDSYQKIQMNPEIIIKSIVTENESWFNLARNFHLRFTLCN
jgi:glycosyltransferase involved in cell wall biosynthesis